MMYWSGGAVLAVVAIVAMSHAFGPHAGHMVIHIALMNLLAPVLAIVAAARLQRAGAKPAGLWLAAATQVGLLWGSHLPAIHDLAMQHSVLRLAVHGMLLASALWFWLSVLTLEHRQGWHGLLALVLTGKLVCLLAALLVFAPRALYSGVHHHGPALLPSPNALDDQHLAGLIMLVACPASYLTAAVILAVRLVMPGRKPDALADNAG
jgi:putative membrane protein